MSDRALCIVLGWALCGIASQVCQAASTVIFNTGFEQSESYVADLPLAGQRGWLGQGTGGNRVTRTPNQQVSLGYNAPTSDSEQSTSLWQPLSVGSIPSDSLIVFKVDMAVVDSTTLGRDEFQWSSYNTNGIRLFSLVFDNSTLRLSYLLSNGSSFDVGTNLVDGHFYSLVVFMDFTRNRWSASLDGHDLPINAPIATGNVGLSLGDIRAVWLYHDPTAPGDNYMLFDNYRVTREAIIAPTLEIVSADNGQLWLRVYGEDGAKYAVEASPVLPATTWSLLGTNTVSSVFFDFITPMSPGFPRRFYRARWVP